MMHDFVQHLLVLVSDGSRCNPQRPARECGRCFQFPSQPWQCWLGHAVVLFVTGEEKADSRSISIGLLVVISRSRTGELIEPRRIIVVHLPIPKVNGRCECTEWTKFDVYHCLVVGAVAKYCNEHVCVSVCLSVCLRAYLSKNMRDLYQKYFYPCCLSPPVGWRNPKGKGQFWGFLPRWQCVVQHSIWDPYENGWTDRHAILDENSCGPKEPCIR